MNLRMEYQQCEGKGPLPIIHPVECKPVIKGVRKSLRTQRVWSALCIDHVSPSPQAEDTQAHLIVSVSLFFQWDEVSVLDDKGKLIRTFEVCNVNQNQRLQDNWLATPFLYRHSAPRVFVTLRFSVRDCASLRSPSPTCRETLTLYYKQADSQRELERTWVAEVRRERGGKCDAV